MAGLADLFGPATADDDEVDVQANPRAQAPLTAGLTLTVPDVLSAPDPNIDMGALQSPTAPSLNYDNSRSVAAVQQANDANPARGGSANPGLYGLLPQGLQHGTLRNVLGALGDAFLVQANHDPEYANNMARQSQGNAVAGMNPNDPASMQAAIQRLAMTGSPDAMKMADQLQTQFESAQNRKAQMAYTNAFHEQTVGNQQEAQIMRRIPYAGGMANSAKDLPSYTAAYQRAEQMAQQIGSQYHASDFGLVDPSSWKPGMQFGLTANNQVVSGDKGLARQVSRENNADNNSNHITVANINGHYGDNRATISADRPSEAQFDNDYIAKRNAGIATTPEEDQQFNHNTQVGRRSKTLPAGRPAAQANTVPTMTAAQARAAQAAGKHGQFRGTDGKMYQY